MMVGNPFLPGFDPVYTEFRGLRLCSYEAGAGPAVVLLHGFGGAASNWAAVAPVLARRCRVVVPELPGHGRSSGLPGPAETLDPYADRIAALLAEPAVVVGHSLGGVIPLRLASRHPELVRGLVLAASAGIASTTRESRRAITLTALVQPGKRISPLRRLVAREALLRSTVFKVVSVSDPRAFEPIVAEGFLAGSALHTGIRDAGKALCATDPLPDLEHA